MNSEWRIQKHEKEVSNSAPLWSNGSYSISWLRWIKEQFFKQLCIRLRYSKEGIRRISLLPELQAGSR